LQINILCGILEQNNSAGVAICACRWIDNAEIIPSRAITTAAGTADVIETIGTGRISMKELRKIVEKTGAVLIWGGLWKSPADEKIITMKKC